MNPLKTTQHALVHIPTYRWLLKFTKNSLCTVYKQTVEEETKHKKKKTKMASARKPESFVWTDNEVELLQLALDYRASTAQYLLQHEHEHVVSRCCYQTSCGSEVEG